MQIWIGCIAVSYGLFNLGYNTKLNQKNIRISIVVIFSVDYTKCI